MAITPMTKVMIVTHRSQAADLLEVLQAEGICQVLDADQAVVSKQLPELAEKTHRPRDIEELLTRLQKTIEFLKDYTKPRRGLESILAPRTVVDEQLYKKVVSDEQMLTLLDQVEQIRADIETLACQIEDLKAILQTLAPWSRLETPVEEIGRLDRTICLAGLVPALQFDQLADQLAELGAAVQQVGTAENKHACLVVCLKENLAGLQKLLRSVEFEAVNFEPMTGTVAELIQQHRGKLNQLQDRLSLQYEKATVLARNLLNLQILADHYSNLLKREQARGSAPATEYTLLLEGWVKKRDYPKLQQIISGFEAASVTQIEPAPDEEIPVEIENKKPFKPFEVITRLYGMPKYFNIDPTPALAPFFAVFFALCLTDAGYGLVIVAFMAFLVKKTQGDKKLMWLLAICAAATVVAGALTGGWFGDAIQKFVPQIKPIRDRLMWFDPLQDPMKFFKLSLALGYFQILTGLFIALVHNIRQKAYAAAICDQLTWLVMLNSIVIVLAGKAAVVPAKIATIFGYVALVPAAVIFLFSHRQGGWAGRLGMGAYNLFSTIFYMGDVLSYLRLMALGMVTAGLAMAINVITEIAGKAPVIGVILMALIFIGGHLFNLAINALGAFVHTLRLQYVEFFPKFLVGGGRQFEPLTKQYKHIYIKK